MLYLAYLLTLVLIFLRLSLGAFGESGLSRFQLLSYISCVCSLLLLIANYHIFIDEGGCSPYIVIL